MEKYVPLKLHVEFERAMYLAFPRLPLPALDGMEHGTCLSRYAKELFTGTSWPEAVGFRLIASELDLSLSIWMDSMPAAVFDYYVASHLMLASILLRGSGAPNYLDSVMEAFLLPPAAGTDESVAEIDDELRPDASVEVYGAVRLDFYRRITPAQRACVGLFLDLYLRHRRERDFTERGTVLFEQNRDDWLYSSRTDLSRAR